ncbi:tumor necrosis factor receptor superfamily member 5 isoform X1 [Sceloporus undulatus]|uniref:tumor necrosis factor receptor superfamily member 5 isoform X1 n=1 Tax=Sceloporus undulatus TaxID=8520 RepID=UPI001C4C38E9|nr:tumor necrosis factor receptor superfamily member 5 isoform X1 [Sceloporus undulatus]
MGRRRGLFWPALMLLMLLGLRGARGGGGGGLGLESLALDQGRDCNATHYKQSQWCCRKCPPGQKVRTECSGTSGDTVCEPCEGQHFQASWTKEKYCTPHGECSENAGLVVHAPGSATRDVKCRCRNGTHCSSHECHTCKKNTPCGPGQGVKHEATHERDTICKDCPDGSFSNASSTTARCQPWSSCEDQNLVQKESGTPSSDVVCDFRLPPHRDAERTHLLALLPLAAILLLGGIFILWYWQRRHKGLQKPQPNQVQQPEEDELMEERLALPIPETLVGGQPVAQEDGKESHLAIQEKA